MQTDAIAIPRPIINKMLHHAQTRPELEVCGLIGIRDQLPVSCYPIKNIAQHPTERYEMDPAELLETMRTMEANNEHLFAIYHSHPHTQAIPSSTDLAMANYPEALYLIISLNTKGVLELRGFRLQTNQPAQEIILLLEQE
ncbi:MAG TPA: M67 family peptidase [Crenotrichaceae bacterium]|nr:M67 family peptidase [Crenotrichaceae bacterium]